MIFTEKLIWIIYNFREQESSGRGRPPRVQQNPPIDEQTTPQIHLEVILQAIQQQITLWLQNIQEKQASSATPPSMVLARSQVTSVQLPAKETERHNESTAEFQGSSHPEQGFPSPPIVMPHQIVLPKFINCNHYFEGMPGKPEEAENWLAHIERLFGVFQVPEALKVPYGSYLLRLRARIWWDSKQRTLLHPITWETFRQEFLKEYFPSSLTAKYCTDLMNLA